MHYEYKTRGTCSSKIILDVDDNKLTHVEYIGGCNGNLQGISRLVQGMDIDEVSSRLGGIRCGMKQTSCPDQLATALQEVKEQLAKGA